MRDEPIAVRELRRVAILTLIAGCSALPSAARAQSAENVAVVINDSSPASRQIGEYYARARALPASNVLRIRTSIEETIDRDVYVRSIEQPLAAAISERGLQDRILYVVLTKGVPLRITGTVGLEGTVASVDSELTLLYRRMLGENIPVRGWVENPYFLGDTDVGEARRFTRRAYDIYLVTRLDAFTIEEARALVDRGRTAETGGRIILDQHAPLLRRRGEDWLELASQRLAAQGEEARVALESTSQPARDVERVLGYFSWGSLDPQNRVRDVRLRFVPGAVAGTFVSSDARTFRPPPDNWAPPANANNRSAWFAGSPDTLTGDLIRSGVTGVAGHIAEPYLQGVVRPQILFPAYLSGFNLVEAFYLAMPYLSWRTVVIGDPLCAPFSRRFAGQHDESDAEDGIDSTTELPRIFATRRLAVVAATAGEAPEAAMAQVVRAEARLARGDREGARRALEEATRLAPQYAGALLQLGNLHYEAGEYDAAIERYGAVLETQPNDIMTLNNLAYSLAVHQNAPERALPLARRALALAPGEANVLDTVGWVEHLAGNDAAAVRLLTRAAQLSPDNAEIRMHAALVHAARGARAVAERELGAALRLDPDLDEREDVHRLRAWLERTAGH